MKLKYKNLFLQYNRTCNIWYGDDKCPKPEWHILTTWEFVIVLFGLVLLMSYGGFYAFTIYRQRGHYAEHLNTEDGNVTPPIYS